LPSQNYFLTRWIFLRLLGVIYFIAFISLWVQIDGLIGSNGILPVSDFLGAVHRQTGPARYHLLPTLFWFSANDGFLHVACGAGVILSLLLIIGITPPLTLFLLWLFYLSLAGVGQEFLSFQWDILLLETGFLAIFLAPWQLWPKLSRQSPSPTLMLWLLWWLLFKLMFSSGLVKLLSGDSTWRNLTALDYHYETQPLPTWIAWYLYQLPEWFQKISVVGMFTIELAVPFLIFAPRRWRFAGCAGLISLQVLILLSGNYTFFNWLTITLCLLLLDDTFLQRFLPKRLVSLFPTPQSPNTLASDPVTPKTTAELKEDGNGAGEQGSEGDSFSLPRTSAPLPRFSNFYRNYFIAALAVIIFSLSSIQMVRMVLPLPVPVQRVLTWIAPFRTINNYGLFAVMTTSRPEIIIEGSNDGETWLPYEFKWKPGDLQRRPRFVAPHQPRLDWQMWFAALSSYQRNPWFVNFMVRLLEGSPEVLGLLADNPFPNAPPRFIRAVVYDYHFTDFNTSRIDGAWWQRGEPRGLYAPVLSLPEQ